jgi:uncharacterized protein (TIGR00297 family)
VSEHSETARQWVHVGSGLFALLLSSLTWPQAASMAAAALAFNALVLPRIGARLLRPVDRARGIPLGIVLYPVAVLLLILVFRTRLDLAAGAWAVLAFGDGAATLIGRRVGGRRWPWNPDKTIAGTAGFAVCAAASAIALVWWTNRSMTPQPGLAFVLLAPAAAAIAAAAAETIPVRLDDNISVPAVAAVVLWLASLMSWPASASAVPAVVRALPSAVVVNALVAWAGYRANSVSMSGAVGGCLIGVVIYVCGGAAAWVLLLLTFIAASAASRLGIKRKMLLGIAEERGGRRGAGNAFANCGIAAAAAVVAVTTPYQALALLALVAALTAGGSDTVASEIGKAWGTATFLVTSFGRVKPGTPGAMSAQGTAAGLVAAFGLAAIAAAGGLIGSSAIPAVVAAATLGALVESALGATLEAPGILNNDMLNFINTAVAAAAAVALA